MKKMCFGTFFTILCQAKLNINQQDFFELIMSAFDIPGGVDSDKGTVGHYKKGEDLVEEIINAAQNTPIELVVSYVNKHLLPKLNKNKNINLVLAIKDILNNDTTLSGSTIIGRSSDFTKDRIINSSTFSLPSLLANVLVYSICDIKNSTCVKNIKEIPKNYLDSFDDSSTKIYFNENPPRINFELDYTAKVESFNNTFVEVEHTGNLPLSNPSNVKIYHLNILNNRFDFRNISQFIKTNIGNYVFSRAKIKDYSLNDDVQSIGLDALRELQRTGSSLSDDNHFSEIMLYSFLECALNAPKIMSKIELSNTGGSFRSHSSGVHLLPSENLSILNHQLVFGASKIVNNLKDAVDNALVQIKEISNNQDEEYNLIEGSILTAIFPPDLTVYLKNLLIPNRQGIDRPDVAYGIFLSYEIEHQTPESISNVEFRNYIKEKMKSDIEAIIPYIYSQINGLGLESSSFYIYVLPLINLNDKERIMENALGVSI